MDAIIQQCCAFALHNIDIEVLWLYGSQAKGTASLHSDYDFAVAFRSIPANEWERRLKPELLAQDWAERLGVADKKISIIDINHIPIPLAYTVISTGKELYVRNPLRLAREENRIGAMWEDNYLYQEKKDGTSL
jgi:predicted nucleotidyltransferase